MISGDDPKYEREAGPQMKNPPHPGRLIADKLGKLGVSISDAAKAFGITRQQLHNLIAGRSRIAAEMAVKLEKAIGGTADTWLRMQMERDLAQIRKREGSIKVKRLAPRLKIVPNVSSTAKLKPGATK